VTPIPRENAASGAPRRRYAASAFTTNAPSSGVHLSFLADEHAAWQIGFPWRDHLPDWFASLAASVDTETYAESVLSIIATVGTYKADADRRPEGRDARAAATLRGVKVGRRR